MSEVTGVFTPGQNYHLTIQVLGNTYQAFVNGTLKTTLVNGTYTSGRVGLYDFSPGAAANQTINQTFDNVVITVPEPATISILGVGVVMFLALRYLRRRVPNETL